MGVIRDRLRKKSWASFNINAYVNNMFLYQYMSLEKASHVKDGYCHRDIRAWEKSCP